MQSPENLLNVLFVGHLLCLVAGFCLLTWMTAPDAPTEDKTPSLPVTN